MTAPQLCRRQFLKVGGALIVSFSWAGAATVALAQSTSAKTKTVAADEVDGFLAVAPDGQVTVYTGKVDLGTGIRTAFRQIVAEELDVPLGNVSLIEGDTATTPDQGPTWGSMSIEVGGMQLRQAAATARKAILERAGQQLGTTIADLEMREGSVRLAKDPAKSVSYAQLLGEQPFQLKLDKSAPLKKPSEYAVVGKPIPRIDIPAKVTGGFTYMHDLTVPGMLHGRVVRPPALGAQLLSVDEGSVRAVKGIVKVVRVGSFLGVVADSEWGAIKASKTLRATWSSWEGLPEMAGIYRAVRRTPIAKDEVTKQSGDTRAALEKASKTLGATYEFPIQTHGSLGPSCAIADVRNGQVIVWSASQAPHWLRKELAAALEVPAEGVRVVYFEGSGCYGRNGHEDAAADAAFLSRAVGRPVRVQWMREDEHGWDPKAPPVIIDLRAGFNEAGDIAAWQSEFWIPKLTAFTDGVPLIAPALAGLPQKDIRNAAVFLFMNSPPPYTVANTFIQVHRLETTPFRSSWIRAPGCLQSTFANESFMDELAVAAGADPLEYRLRQLNDPRGVEVLKAAATRAGWQPRKAPAAAGLRSSSSSGRGVAYVKYFNAKTYVAAIAEVEATGSTGSVLVKRIVIAQDCGQIINPDGARNQVEGCAVQTVSRTMKEELKWDRSRVTSVDWKTYPILTFPEVPDVEVELIDRPNERPWGVGEPAASVIPAAIGNAIFDALGVRLRAAPFTAERVKAAVRRTA